MTALGSGLTSRWPCECGPRYTTSLMEFQASMKMFWKKLTWCGWRTQRRLQPGEHGPGSTERAEKRCVRLQSGWWGEFTVWKKKKVCTSKRTHYSTVKLFPLHLPACWAVGVRVSVRALREFGAVCQRGGVGVQTFWSVDMHSEFRNVHVGFWVKSLNMFHPTRLSASFGLGQFSPPTSCWRELGDKSEQI